MQKIIIIPLILIMLYSMSESFCADITGPQPLRNNPEIKIDRYLILGEELEYLAKWTGFPAGTIITRIWKKTKEYGGKELILFQALIKTNDFVSIFYPVKSILRSYTELDTGFSRIFTRKEIEGDYRANDRVDYNYEYTDALGENIPRINISLIKNNTVEDGGSRDIPGKISDPLSLNWLIRGLDFNKINERKSILIGDRFTTGIITLTFLKEEIISIPNLGRFDCLVVKPQATTYNTSQNLLQIEGNALIWLEKNTKIILRAEADLPIGKASAIITGYRNTNLNLYKLKDNEQE